MTFLERWCHAMATPALQRDGWDQLILMAPWAAVILAVLGTLAALSWRAGPADEVRHLALFGRPACGAPLGLVAGVLHRGTDRLGTTTCPACRAGLRSTGVAP